MRWGIGLNNGHALRRYFDAAHFTRGWLGVGHAELQWRCMNLYIPTPFRYQAEVLPCRETGKAGFSPKQLKTERKLRAKKQSPAHSLNQYLGTGRSIGRDARSSWARRTVAIVAEIASSRWRASRHDSIRDQVGERSTSGPTQAIS